MSENYDIFRRFVESGTKNFIQSAYDQFAKENAKFREKAGLKTIIIREALGECCSWCSGLAGTYHGYENAREDVFARHKECNCVVSVKTEKGKWKDAWSKKEYKTFRENRIAREKEILEEQNSGRINNITAKTAIREEPPRYKNITADYWKKASPGQGTVLKEQGYNDKKHGEEISFANWLHDTIGGNIILNKDSTIKDFHFADYTWNEKLWDLKTISSSKFNTIDQHIRDGHKQIMTNRGGIMIDMSNNQMNFNEMLDEVSKSLQNRNLPTTDIFLKKNQNWGIFRVYVNK